MSDVVLRVQGLGKRYRLGLREGGSGGMYRYKSLRDSFGRIVRQPWKSLTAGRGPMSEDNSFWALKEVDFEVKRGEVVGIIGRNGAGKSTLLKILSRITKPTTGCVDLYGRVGSLLEVGTGFHPELSGRENIYLNGAILGMTRAEVKSKFDEIVAFSEIEKFIDTPVKQYSSGMYMRLAFAVAAHLDPEILVVDEVLAVGDAAFQKKCLGKMKDVAAEGRTILFVSHNMGAMMNLCSRCGWLAAGKLLAIGGTSEVVRRYLGDGAGELGVVSFTSGPLRRCEIVSDQTEFRITADYETTVPVDLPALGFVVSTSHGVPVLGDNPRLSRVDRPPQPSTRGKVTAAVKSPRLRDGDYIVSLWFGDSSSDMASYPDALRFSIAGQDGGGATNPEIVGSVVPDSVWKFSPA